MRVILVILISLLLGGCGQPRKGRESSNVIIPTQTDSEICNLDFDKLWNESDKKCETYLDYKKEFPYVKGRESLDVLPSYYRALFQIRKEGNDIKKKIFIISIDFENNERIQDDIIFLDSRSPIDSERFYKLLFNQNYLTKR